MHKLYELKEKLCKEMEDFETEPMTPSKVDAIYKLASAAKNLDKMIKAKEEEEGGYSERGSYRGGSYRGGSYEGGSYNEGGSYDGGSYARGRRNAPRDSMGRYSGEGYSRHGDMAEELRSLMDRAPDAMKRELQRLADKMEDQR